MKHLLPAIRIKIFITILCGLVYPFVMTGVSQMFFANNASGNFISRGGQIVGSKWIAQNFEKPEYFWPRPSGVGFNPLPSGGSNLGPTSADLKKAVDDRKTKLLAIDPTAGEPPAELLYASASGLDPHISPDVAKYQIPRVARARKMDIDIVQKLVAQATQDRQLKILGEPTVNVLELNLALDKAQGIESAPILVPVPSPSK